MTQSISTRKEHLKKACSGASTAALRRELHLKEGHKLVRKVVYAELVRRKAK